MDGNNVHTSVVIELANQEESEEQKTYKIDFNEVDTPKDYVIDQIFCGENITVYALFEIPENGNKKSDGEIREIQNATVTDDFRFIHKNSFKNSVQYNSNVFNKKLSMKDSDEELSFSTRNEDRNRSFHGLKHLGKNYDIPSRQKDSAELKVLFSNDFVMKGPRQSTFKSVSKGVNTEITQSPKILEEVQRAITINYNGGRSDWKRGDKGNILSGKPSYEIIDVEVQPSFSSFSSASGSRRHGRISSPNFLFVPLIMMDGRSINHSRRDRNHTQLEEKALETKTHTTPTKVSLGTNTDAVDCTPRTTETDDGRETNSSSSQRASSTKDAETADGSKERTQLQMNKKDKNTILKEIRKLQGKLNALIKSIEYNNLDLSANEDDEYPEMEAKTSEEMITKVLNEVQEPAAAESEMLRLNKFDEIPIFSPMKLGPVSRSGKTRPKKRAPEDVKAKPSVETVKSTSSGFVSHQEEIPPAQKIRGQENLKANVFSGLDIDWDSSDSGKGMGASKSDTNNRSSLPVPKPNGLKKSLSFVLRDDKLETSCLKKIKNTAFKFEGGLKTNLRIIQNKEVPLGDNLSSISGDEIKRRVVVSKTETQDLVRDQEKEEVENSRANAKKTQKEDEGDAKWICPKEDLMPPKFVQNPAVHYCSTSTIVADELIKTVKSAVVSMEKKSTTATKPEESRKKASGDPEKPSTPNRTGRKGSAMDTGAKKEVKTTRKIVTRSKTVEKRTPKKETVSFEGLKPKSVSGSRKFTVKGTAESKLHVDKLMKKLQDSDSKPEPANNPKTPPKANVEEKPSTAKNDKPGLTRSLKRDIREKTPDAAAVGRKPEPEKKPTKKKSAPSVVAETKGKSLKDLNRQVKVDSVMVFESVENGSQESEAKKTPSSSASSPSSVVVELLSKKPTSLEEFCSEVNQGQSNNGGSKNDAGNSLSDCQSENQEKPIVKSVWALTKVLLYEDGTKKLEVLEASLTPPGYCLKSSDNPQTSDKNSGEGTQN